MGDAIGIETKVEPRERVVGFGTREDLAGIVTLPAENLVRFPAFVFLNSGLIHRVGACRMSVKLSRELAKMGAPSLRFDFSGIGDSGPRRPGSSLEQGHVEEVSEALDFLQEEFGWDRFVLYGLCSGARDAFHAALEDRRVVGIGQVDGFAYRTWKFFLYHYGRRVGRLRAWGTFLRKQAARFRARDVLHRNPGYGEDMVLGVWAEYPPRQEVMKGYGTLVRRGVQLYVLFTGSWEGEYNHLRQFYDMYPEVDFGENLVLRHMPEAVHILPEPSAQAQVIRDVVAWMGSRAW